MILPDFELETIAGERVKLSDFPAKAILVVNTASHCAFTPQYAALEQLYHEYRSKGLIVMGFPCDQFGHQEPGANTEIASFCQKNYGVSFPMFAKTKVNGPDAHPLYVFLKDAAPGFLGSRSIKWNFTKFLIVLESAFIRRYGPQATPRSCIQELKKL